MSPAAQANTGTKTIELENITSSIPCEVVRKTPFVYFGTVFYEHEIKCIREMDEIFVSGRLWWAPLSGGPSQPISSSYAENTCPEANTCKVVSQDDNAPAGVYHGYTEGWWIEKNDPNRRKQYVPRTQSYCFTYTKGAQRITTSSCP